MTECDLSRARWYKSSYSSQNGACVEVAYVLPDAAWQKSSHSSQDGNCVEVARVILGADWHKSTYSGQDGNCVEVARDLPGVVAVRDSKDPADPKLTFTPAAWHAFTKTIRDTGRA